MITSGADGRLTVWAPSDGTGFFTMTGLPGGINALALSTIDTRLAVLGTNADGATAVKIWKIPSR